MIDEAQHLAADVLEQLRLLTNLETDSRKLLKVLLVGQPELQRKHLQTTQLRQQHLTHYRSLSLTAS
ncbi:AAA family ATPase [Vibrio lentus]|nr:AAA family ATPase [Vibrio lentus]